MLPLPTDQPALGHGTWAVSVLPIGAAQIYLQRPLTSCHATHQHLARRAAQTPSACLARMHAARYRCLLHELPVPYTRCTLLYRTTLRFVI